MKVAQINVTCGIGSTGKICVSISKRLEQQGVENYILYSSGNSDYPLGIKYTRDLYIKFQALKSRLFGNYGFNSQIATMKLIKELEKIKPDIVLLHNLHGHNCNLEMLFRYLKEKQIKVYWTFHDCWAFTGYCAYFDLVKCEQWKINCAHCPSRKKASWFFDRSKYLFDKKRTLFSGLDMTIITPSQWLANLVKESFLNEYPVRVINNGIDLSVFKPTESDFRQQYSIENKYILLGVAFGWGERKGLDVFIELSERLDQERYQIVLVGADKDIDQQLPKEIISIHRTKNQAELASIYTAADLFLNPTREDNYPTVNMEAIACGTPVLTFKTGGSGEMLDESCGCAVECDDFEAMIQKIHEISCENNYSKEACLKKAQEFCADYKYAEYVSLITKES